MLNPITRMSRAYRKQVALTAAKKSTAKKSTESDYHIDWLDLWVIIGNGFAIAVVGMFVLLWLLSVL